MKKSTFLVAGIFTIIVCCLFISLGIVSAINDTTSNSNAISTSTPSSTLTSSESRNAMDKAYKCLENQIKNKSVSSMSLQEAIYSMLALGTKKNLQDKLDNEKSSSENCWPKNGCTIKESAQVALAYKSNENILRWLLSKNATSNDLNWYLEVDISNHVPAECTLKYDNSEKKINILEDMRITGNPGSCLSISSSGYWLSVRENCYDKEIQISCNKDFITTLLYEKKSGGTIYVLPDTHSAVALGTTNEKVSVKCFKTGNTCDYEGSLWAALTLYKNGKNINAFVPYLIALADNNQKYFPSSFLYALTGSDDYYSNIVQNQKQERYWKMVGTPYGEYYDTSLAMLALGKSSSTELENAKNYLLSIQTNEGCWNNNNIRDTAFLLYSGWPKDTVGGGGSGGTTPSCELVTGQSCENSNECTDAGGNTLSNFYCSGFNVCCSIEVQKQNCSSLNGLVCPANKECDGRTVSSADGTCCLNSCTDVPEEDTCAIIGGTCRTACKDNEEEITAETCTGGNVCCEEKQASEKSWTWLIILLVILIILVILAITFRNKIKIWWFKFKGKAKVSPVVRPGTPPAELSSYKPTRQVYRPSAPSGFAPRTPVRMPMRKPVPSSAKDKEMEETLNKLKEMSK